MIARIHLTIQCSRCDRTTRGSARLVQQVDLEWYDVDFERDADGKTGWVVRGEEALCPEHAPTPPASAP
jgi:hypothetical protein